MWTKQDILDKKEQLLTELEREKGLLQLDSILNTRLSENAQKYKSLSNQIRRVINVIAEKQLLRPLVLRYEKELRLHEDGLYFNGVFVPCVPFNNTDCFEVFNKVNTGLVDKLTTIMRNWTAFRNHPSAQQMTMTVASMYNTMIAMYHSVEGLCQESANKIRAELGQAQEEATHKIGELETEIRRLDEEEGRLMAQLEQVCKYATFSDYSRKTATKDFPAEPVVLPLAYGVDTPVALEWDLSRYNGVRLIVPKKRMERADESLCAVVKNIVYQFINHYPAGVTQCALYNPRKMQSMDRFMNGLLQANGNQGRDRISDDSVIYPTDQSSIDLTMVAFKEACDLIDQCHTTDVFSFNCENPDAATPIRLFIIFGCAASHRMTEVMANTIENARNKGVFLLLVETIQEEMTEKVFAYRQAGDVFVNELKNMMTLELSDITGDLQVQHNGEQYQLAASKNTPDDELEFSNQLCNAIMKWQKRPIPLDKVFDAFTRGVGDFSEKITIPVGIGEKGGLQQLLL